MLADEAAIINNSGKKPRWVFKIKNHKIVSRNLRDTALDRKLWDIVTEAIRIKH
jgi:hypothetical protein